MRIFHVILLFSFLQASAQNTDSIPQNRIGTSYNITTFNNDTDPWHSSSLWYLRKEAFGSFGARVNYSDRHYANGFQFELDAYPIHKTGYSYANLAFSNASILPSFRGAYSYYFPFKKTWEGEIGGRYLNHGEQFWSFTGGLGKYLGSYLLNVKTFITPYREKVAPSFVLSARHYMSDSPDDYLSVAIGYGFSPDDRGANIDAINRVNFESVRLNLGYQRTIRQSILGVSAGINRQEIAPERKRTEFDVSLSWQYKF